MEYLGAIAILALVGFIAFRNKALFQSKQDVDPGISKVFYILIFLVPVIIVLLYSMKLQNSGITPNDPLLKNQQYKEPSNTQQPNQDPKFFDAPAGREEGFSL